mmetsp:Transcript_7374/g.21772  ORF Transcript_7374/g.21772 Transcript_7374/m.21772 type:complete len:223 (+) Transcript_7374:849-1517(+)
MRPSGWLAVRLTILACGWLALAAPGVAASGGSLGGSADLDWWEPQESIEAGFDTRKLLAKKTVKKKKASKCVIVLPWNNPNVLAAVTQANRIGKVKTYPYQKFLRYDPRFKQWNYLAMRVKAGCTVRFDWTVPKNAKAQQKSHGVATSTVTACNTNPARYKILAKPKPNTSFDVVMRKQKGTNVLYFWDPRDMVASPGTTPDPYDQMWIACQYGVYIAILVV